MPPDRIARSSRGDAGARPWTAAGAGDSESLRLGSAARRATVAQLQKCSHRRHAGPLVVEALPERSRRLNLMRRVAWRFAVVAKLAAFPQRLTELPDAPHLLYVRGEFTTADSMAVAIVGSR